MLTIAPISNANYYLGQTMDALDEYYTRGEAPGRWAGTGARSLSLEGTVNGDDLRAVLEGRSPADGQSLLSAAALPRRARPGFDFTFSAPKGVSLLGLLGERDMQEAVLAAHTKAVGEALGYLEREATFVRRGHNGALRLPAKGLVTANFVHTSSRLGDPQLHSHLLVANLAQGPDGSWSAPCARTLYRHSRTAGFLYQAALRDELTRSLGVRWRPVERGMAEPDGIAANVLRHFSRRRGEIESALEEAGASSARAANIAAHATRAPKDHDVDASVAVASWRLRAERLGLGREALRALAPCGRQPAPLELDDLAEHLLGPEGLTRNRSTFSRQEVLRALAGAAPEGASVAQLELACAAILSDDRAVKLGPAGPEQKWSTAEMLATESALLNSALEARTMGRVVVAPSVLEQALSERPALAGEQADAVGRLVGDGDGDGLAVLVGPAGTGKTFVLEAARAAWESSGHQVIGTALAARTAAALGASAGMPSFTLARLLSDISSPEGALQPGSVLVVDEAGMVGTRDLAKLWSACQASESKLVLAGDWAQVPEIEAGGMFAALAQGLGAPELTVNRRQAEDWERAALAQLRSGSPAAAVEMYASHGRVVSAETGPGAHQTMVADWWTARSEGHDAVMFALSRAEVDSLNRLARGLARDAGQVRGPDLEVGGRQFALGDEVVALRNDRRLGVLNGLRGTVTALDPVARSLTMLTQSGTELALPEQYLGQGHLGWGYAVTLHKGQGSTVDRAYLLGSEALYREAGYTGLSRGRGANHLYMVAGGAFEGDSHLPELTERDELGQLTAALSRSGAQSLASKELAQDPRTGARATPGPGPQLERLVGSKEPHRDGRPEVPADRWAELAQRDRDSQEQRRRGLARERSIGEDRGR